MQKLLFITTNIYGSGGVSRVLSVRTDYLIKKYDYTVHIINTNNFNITPFYEFNSNTIFHNISVKSINIWNINAYKKQLINVINNIQPDVIINCDNGLKGSLLPYLIKTKASLIYEMHGSKDMIYDKWLVYLKFKLSNYILQRSIKKYNHFVVLTEDHAKEWVGVNIDVIPNPITILPSLKNINRQKIVLAVGRFSSEKGYERLLHIWSKVSPLFPDWKLIIYGEGYKNKYKNLLQQLNILKTVDLKEAVNNIEEAYASASLLVNSSFSEAFPLTMIEAMHCGLPVIAFETLGSRELIINQINGFLIENDNLEAYANKTCLLIEKGDVRKQMGQNAKQSVEKLRLDNIMNMWHELFQSVS